VFSKWKSKEKAKRQTWLNIRQTARMRKDGKNLLKVYLNMAIAAIENSTNAFAFSPERSEGLTYLEQLTALAGICSAFNAPFIAKINDEKREIELARVPCGLWSCPECSVRNARRWIARIIDGINNLDAENWYFATVTAHRKWRGLSSLKNLRANWPKLRKRMSRATIAQNEVLYYVRNWEKHKDGSFHTHIITNAPLSTRWLKDNAAQCGLGYQAKMDECLNAGQAAGYMAKYFVKQHGSTLHTYPKGARRVQASQNWIAWHVPEVDSWRFVGNFATARVFAIFSERQRGYKVFDLAIREEENRLKTLTSFD
jgi:hypothetical protein